MSGEIEKRLEAMEMWCWRRLLRVSWTQIRGNKSILGSIGSRREMLAVVRRQQMALLGHVVKAEG